MNPTKHNAARGRGCVDSDAGFTITEVLIAVFVLAIGLIGVISVFPVGIKATRSTLDSSSAAAAVNTAVATLQYQLDSSDHTPIEAYEGGSNPLTLFPDFGNAATVGLDTYPILSVYDSNGAVEGDKARWNAVLSAAPVASGTAGRLVLAQIAFFRNAAAPQSDGNGANTVAFTSGSATLTFSQYVPIGLSAGCYIRRRDGGAAAMSTWYLIDSVNKANKQVTLSKPYGFASASAAKYVFTEYLFETVLTVR